MSTEDYKQMVTPCDDPYPMTTPPTPAQSDTPLTDAAVTGNSEVTTEEYEDLAHFARTLERALAAKEAEVARLTQENLDHAEDWAMCGIPHDSLLAKSLVLSDENRKLKARTEKAEAELATAKASGQNAFIEAGVQLAKVINERDQLRAEVKRLRQGLWDIFRALGGDTDGEPTPEAVVSDIISPALELAKDTRNDIREMDEELEKRHDP